MPERPVKKARVLIIDDSEISRMVVGEILTGAGYEVHPLESPLGATAEILRQEIDLVVVDMQMPVMSGPRFVELVRRNPKLGHVKLVLITGAEREELEAAGRESGADEVVSKRTIQSTLPGVVSRLLRDGAEERAGGRVLVVADRAEVAEEVGRRLMEAGYEVSHRNRGRGTLLAVVEQKPDLVLVLDGLVDVPTESVIALLRENRRSTRIPVLLLGEGEPLALEARAREVHARGALNYHAEEDALQAALRAAS